MSETATPTRTTLFRVSQVIIDIFQRTGRPMASPDITAATELSTLGCDSLDRIEIAMGIEEEFDCELADDAIEALVTVADVVALVDRTVVG